jgi:hypothetical protein
MAATAKNKRKAVSKERKRAAQNQTAETDINPSHDELDIAQSKAQPQAKKTVTIPQDVSNPATRTTRKRTQTRCHTEDGPDTNTVPATRTTHKRTQTHRRTEIESDNNSAEQVPKPVVLETLPEEVELPVSDTGSDVVEIVEQREVRKSVKKALSMFAGMDSEGEEFEDDSDENAKSDESDAERLDPGSDDWDKEWDKVVQPRRDVSVKPAKAKLPKGGNLKGMTRKRVEVSDKDSDELDLSDSQSGGNIGEFCLSLYKSFHLSLISAI